MSSLLHGHASDSGDSRRVCLVANDNSTDALAASVGVKRIRLLLDILALARLCALGNSLGKERHKLADTGTGEARVLAEVLFRYQLGRFVLAAIVTDDLLKNGYGSVKVAFRRANLEWTYANVVKLHSRDVSL